MLPNWEDIRNVNMNELSEMAGLVGENDENTARNNIQIPTSGKR